MLVRVGYLNLKSFTSTDYSKWLKIQTPDPLSLFLPVFMHFIGNMLFSVLPFPFP